MDQNFTMAYGLKILSGNHRSLIKLRKNVRPLEHGHKIWASSWLLIDYLHRNQAFTGSRVLDLGCGWGLTGIYCAKAFKSEVVWADVDAAVHPYLCLMAESNQIDVNFINMGIDQISLSLLEKLDVIVASDICFCDTLIDPLRRLVHRAKAARVKKIFISDPGRWPFEDLAEIFLNKTEGELITWESQRQPKTAGKILKIKFDNEN